MNMHKFRMQELNAGIFVLIYLLMQFNFGNGNDGNRFKLASIKLQKQICVQ